LIYRFPPLGCFFRPLSRWEREIGPKVSVVVEKTYPCERRVRGKGSSCELASRCPSPEPGNAVRFNRFRMVSQSIAIDTVSGPPLQYGYFAGDVPLTPTISAQGQAGEYRPSLATLEVLEADVCPASRPLPGEASAPHQWLIPSRPDTLRSVSTRIPYIDHAGVVPPSAIDALRCASTRVKRKEVSACFDISAFGPSWGPSWH
jgi:hypothetical protein